MKRMMPEAMRKLINKIKITSSLIDGSVLVVKARELNNPEGWVHLPSELLMPNTKPGAASLLLAYYDADLRVYMQIMEEGTRMQKILIPDANEFIQVQVGRVLENVTGTVIEIGKPFFAPVGQVHQFIALETSILTYTVKYS